MKWRNHIILLLICIFLLIVINSYNKQLYQQSNEILIINNQLEGVHHLLNFKDRISELENIVDDSNKVLVNNKIKKLQEYLEKELLIGGIPIDLERLEMEHDNLKNKRSRIELINMQTKTKRTFILFCLFIVAFATFLFELSKLRHSDRKISKYISGLLYRNYDIETEDLNLPYISNIATEIKSLKESLNLLDEAISVTLKKYNLKDTLKEIYQNENFKKYIKFDRIGFANVTDNEIIAQVSFSDRNIIKLGKGFKVSIDSSKSLKELITNNEIRIINDLEEYNKIILTL